MDPNLNPFLRPRLRPKSVDRFFIRQSILDAVRRKRQFLKGTILDVGCGQMPYRSELTAPKGSAIRYIGLDFEVNPIHDNQPDIVWKDGRIPLDEATVDSAILTEVLEHCPDPDSILAEVFRVIKPGGILFLTVPYLWPLHEVPFDNYRYTPFALRRHLEKAGFDEVTLEASGGWDASLATMLGLWVRRSGLGRIARALLSIGLLPVYKWLIWRDRKRPVTEFKEGTMLTGLTGTAMKPVAQTRPHDGSGV